MSRWANVRDEDDDVRCPECGQHYPGELSACPMCDDENDGELIAVYPPRRTA